MTLSMVRSWPGVVVASFVMLGATPAHATKYSVNDAAGLQSALGKVAPGDVIVLAAGTYRGSFVATRSGAKGNPITLKGPAGAVLTNSGYGFSLKANYWKLTGFTVNGASKGIVLDNAHNNLLDKLTVKNVDGEGIHFRTFSSDNVLRNSTVSNTGLDTPGYGEGVYAGSAVSNWPVYTDGKPDTSDRNCIANNHIGPGVTAEGIDLKEGTTGGIVVGNTYDATGISGENYGDSFIDAKGNGYHIYGNKVTNPSKTSVLKDGFQTHVAYTGYGKDNIFQANTVDLQSSGYGFYITTSGTGNKVCTDNSVTHAGSGVANVSQVSCSNPQPVCPKVLNLPLK